MEPLKHPHLIGWEKWITYCIILPFLRLWRTFAVQWLGLTASFFSQLIQAPIQPQRQQQQQQNKRQKDSAVLYFWCDWLASCCIYVIVVWLLKQCAILLDLRDCCLAVEAVCSPVGFTWQMSSCWSNAQSCRIYVTGCRFKENAVLYRMWQTFRLSIITLKVYILYGPLSFSTCLGVF